MIALYPEAERRRRALARMTRPPRASKIRDRAGPLLDVSALRAGQGHADDPACGVVIGAYWHAPLIELAIRAIRFTCGNVPILVSDDCSPGGRSEAMAVLCERLGVLFRSNPQRLGHVAGDLSAFAAGIEWAAELGLEVLAKVSQRWICTVPRWLNDGAAVLLDAGCTLAGEVQLRPYRFPLRSECCLLDVAAWQGAGMPEALRGRPIHASAEVALDRLYRERVGDRRLRWPLVGQDRTQPVAGVLWHDNTSERDYRQLGGYFGVDLGPEFSRESSDRLPGYHL